MAGTSISSQAPLVPVGPALGAPLGATRRCAPSQTPTRGHSIGAAGLRSVEAKRVRRLNRGRLVRWNAADMAVITTRIRLTATTTTGSFRLPIDHWGTTLFSPTLNDDDPQESRRRPSRTREATGHDPNTSPPLSGHTKQGTRAFTQPPKSSEVRPCTKDSHSRSSERAH